MSSHGLFDPIFANETVNSDRYLHTLQNDFLPQLRVKGLYQQTRQYMQDGASTDIENFLLDLLNTILILYLPCIVQKTTFKTKLTCTGIYTLQMNEILSNLFRHSSGVIFRDSSLWLKYRGADKYLALPGRKHAKATDDFDVHISYLQS